MLSDTLELRHQLLELERGFWTAGVEFYEERLARDCVMVFPGAGILSRDAVIAAIAAASRWVDVEMADVHVAPLGEGAAILAYAAEARRDGSANPYSALVSSACVRQHGSGSNRRGRL